ncbi:SH3 domain containing protein 6 [Sarcoptes scabiei]|uniref:SH3 domain containing protein 6 n=1 Tax=Sarcoptes scabiei TaxID=52283 RepID=A0A132AJE4_SARSC|nr:SH3 domain containing protein 6 [Sarcoptes scabiei]
MYMPSSLTPKPQRLLPANIFVVLYNFRSRQIDELNLRPGYLVTVIDTTDHDWWQGKCMGKVGFFPSKYVTKLFPGERPLQVIHTVQLTDGEFAIKLLREQIVIQVSEELNGIIMVRTGTNDKIVPCPSKYLQEIII